MKIEGWKDKKIDSGDTEHIYKTIVEVFQINCGGEIRIVKETLRIKELLNCDQSEVVLVDTLKRLQLMTISMDTLKKTMIGTSVKSLTKHNSKRIRQLARYLIIRWRRTVDQWVIASEASSVVTETMEVVNQYCSSDSIFVDDEEKLRDKLEASKRKLKEGYQRFENAKKQRRIQIIELKDLVSRPQGFLNK